jgi:hypothetical protein
MGLKYRGQFDSIRTNSRYIVGIYQDSYTGDVIDVILSATPVIHEWQEDDPLTPIKGSTLTINLTTSGGLQLLDFYSDNDNEFRVELLGDDVTGTQITLFDGFIQQDDCTEVQIDFIHTITLTATDNLGTIKDINLGRAAELFGDVIAVGGIDVAFVPGSYIVIDYGPSWPVIPGQTFTVGGTPFTMIANLGEIDPTYDGWCIQVVENIPSPPPGTLAISYKEIVSLDGYIPLITFIKLCLRSTYVKDLELNVYNHITPSDGEIFTSTFQTRIFEDVTILANTFLKNNEYMSCYDVLEIIMKRFNMTCFQSLGSWWIVRIPDLFLDFQEGETILDYYNYDAINFEYVDILQINKSFVIDSNNKVETGLLKSIIRPFRRTLETFNYIQPEDLLCNSNLSNLGSLITTYSSGGNTINEYSVPCWEALFEGNFFIRQVINSDNREIDRFVYTVSNSAGLSQPIALEENDIIDWSFQVRTDDSLPGFFTFIFYQGVSITNGTTTYYLKNDGSWTTTNAFENLTFQINTGDNANQWHAVNFKSKRVPIDCLMSIKLTPATVIVTAGLETLYKDMRLSISYEVAGQGLVNGHTHNASQSRELNNINDLEIFIDNSERSSISGTLFLTSQTGVLQDKCITWQFGYGYNTGFPSKVYNNLGQQITETYMYQRYKSRTKFNGNLLSIRNDNGVLSNLAIFSNEFAGDLLNNKMLLGSVAIDYKNDSAEFTMWEVFNKDLPYTENNFADFNNYLFNILYQFNYLYENN